jgi:hypothetical protein
VQRLVGSVGVEALPGWYFKQSFDKYCGVNCRRRDRHQPFVPARARLKVKAPFITDATPQKSSGSREAIIHTRLKANSEHPCV